MHQPMVHAGFLKAWRYQTYEAEACSILDKAKGACNPIAKGEPLNQRIISRVMWLIDNLTPGEGKCRKLLVTGE